MIRKVAFLFAALLFYSVAAQAQISTDKIELYGGYSFMHFNDNGGGGSFNQNGWELAGQYKFLPFLGAVADFSGDYGNGVNTHYFLVGPQVSFPWRISPFAHAMVGAARVGSSFDFGNGVQVSASDTSFAEAFGGGVDARIKHGLYWRIAQIDYIHSNVFGSAQNNTRISTGIVIHF